MHSIQTIFNPEISSLLDNYPQWQQMLHEAINKPPLDVNYCPFIIEIFDQYGLLAGRVNQFGCYESTRKKDEESKFIAWLFDGELAIFYVDSLLLLNRMSKNINLN